MKRYLVLAAILAGLLVLLLHWRSGKGNAPTSPDTAVEAPAARESNGRTDVPNQSVENSAVRANQNPVMTNEAGENQKEPAGMLQAYNEAQNVPVALYGRVVDQDTNGLEGVRVDLEILEQYRRPAFQVSERTTNLQRHTGQDGRFEVIGPIGHTVTVTSLTREGYEPEIMQKQYGIFTAKSTSLDNPAVFRMWSTSIPHERLIAGQESSVIIPDGRRYGIDLTSAAIAEGAEGDLVVWIKRPASVGFGERYGWSCGLAASGGGLAEETGDAGMCIAPATGYKDAFTYQEEPGVDGWSGGFYAKRFFVMLRNGQVYGRISVNLRASPSREGPAVIALQHTINASGSRLLR